MIKQNLPETFNLDIGCGYLPQEGFIGLDKRNLDTVTIVQDVEEFPWPIKDNSVKIALCSHLLEHLNPQKILDFFEEVHRILVPGGSFFIAVPYAGSFQAYQDPTHVRPGFNEATWNYFDPREFLWGIYRPSPFLIEDLEFRQDASMRVRLRCIKPEWVKEGKVSQEILEIFKQKQVKGFYEND